MCHVCDVPRCVNPTHLFVGTRKENMQDARRKGRLSTGASHSRALAGRDFCYDSEHARRTSEGVSHGEASVLAKLTDADVHEIRFGRFRGWRQIDVAAVLNVSQSLVCMVRKRRVWKHLP